LTGVIVLRFLDKVVVVTGGSKGIGLAAAIKFSEEGAKIAIIGSSEQTAQDAVREVYQITKNKNIIGFGINVSDSKQVQSMVSEVVSKFGSIDILINSAGVQRYGSVVDTDEFTWDEVINVNLKGMFLTSKYVIPEMRRKGQGSIINVSSVQAYASQKQVAAYTASKGGINALTRAMALDHAEENIRINSVSPASIDTPMLRWAADKFKGEGSQDDVIKQWGKTHPIGRVGTGNEVAELIAFLCSDEAGFITGADYKIDGGVLSALAVNLPDA
jgi:NAD(P)-dependent dehydrogenase (short-subunit alcohol dehydrogenase family)